MTPWLDFIEHNKPIIDCRLPESFIACHLESSVNIPVADLFDRMQELPRKDQSLFIIVDTQSEKEAKQFFSAREFDVVDYADWSRLNRCILDLAGDQYFATGESQQRFWQPAPFVDIFSQQISGLLNGVQGQRNQFKVLDVACGSGRDAIYLAMQGWKVFGIDYSETALQRCRRTAEHYKVSLELACADLENSFSVDQLNGFPKQFNALIVCRYLHRPLWNVLKSWLLPGGIIGYQTFMKGSELIGSPRNPNFLLQAGELSKEFQGFDILLDDIDRLPDGRPMSRFIARKPIR